MNEHELEILLATKCPICLEISKCSDSLSILLGKNERHIIYQNSNFSLLNDINPVVEGHAILVTNNHYTSFGQIPSSLINSFVEIKKNTDSIYLNKYGAYFLFEHGTSILGSECRNCVSHAHIHYIPCSITIENYFEPFSSELSNGNNADIMSVLKASNCEYLYYENHRRDYIFVRNPIYPIPKQFLRMIMAKEFSIKNWNWRLVLTEYLRRNSNVNY